MKTRALILTLLATAGTFACDRSTSTSVPDGQPSSPASTPGASNSPLTPKGPIGQTRPPHPPPNWYASLPAKPVTAKPGDRVWALHQHNGEGASLDVAEVLSVEGETATVTRMGVAASGKLERSPWGETFALVPGAGIFPAHKVAELDLKAGDMALSYRYNSRHPFLGRVKEVKDGMATMESPSARVLRDTNIEYAERVPTAIAPLASVAIKMPSGWRRAAVALVEGDTVYAVDGTFRFVTAKIADCKLLQAEPKDRKVGQKVFVFPLVGEGYEDTVAQVVVPKWIFDTKRGPDVPFDRVFDPAGF